MNQTELDHEVTVYIGRQEQEVSGTHHVDYCSYWKEGKRNTGACHIPSCCFCSWCISCIYHISYLTSPRQPVHNRCAHGVSTGMRMSALHFWQVPPFLMDCAIPVKGCPYGRYGGNGLKSHLTPLRSDKSWMVSFKSSSFTYRMFRSAHARLWGKAFMTWNTKKKCSLQPL